MFIQRILLRSYRSFNFDYRKKMNTGQDDFASVQRPWEATDDLDNWRPWVEVPIQAPIASIVGLNEAGKSHLIDALEKYLRNSPFSPEDVCRYSEECRFGRVGKPCVGVSWVPDRGTSFVAVADVFSTSQSGAPAQAAADSAGEIPLPEEWRSLTTLINGAGVASVYVEDVSGRPRLLAASLSREQMEKLRQRLPRVVRISQRVSLPSSVRMADLFRLALEGKDDSTVQGFLNQFKDRKLFNDINHFKLHQVSEDAKLVYRLLQQCANVNYDTLAAVAQSSEQLLKEFSAQATAKAEELLSLGHWWGQDVDAKIGIDLRSNEVVLNLTDRTGSWYGFAERSQGMRFFLGYVLQVLLEIRDTTRRLIILSDEPDFALSAVGQHDLLRFFKRVSAPESKFAKCQIIFTTHSAELIDPNYPDRITVLRKGLFEEGTLAVAHAHRRLFEPVRSALSGRAASLPFLDGPNLVVEGLSDRTFIMRMSQYFAKRQQPHIDLSDLSIVVAEGCHRMVAVATVAKSIPGDRVYLTFLLDNDRYARPVISALEKLDPEIAAQIVRVSDALEPGLGKDTELEDLVPPILYAKALREVVQTTWPPELVAKLSDDAMVAAATTQPILDGVEAIIKAGSQAYEVDKEAVIDRVFDLLEAEQDEGRSHLMRDFVGVLQKLTSALIERISENLRMKRHDEIRRAMTHVAREFGQEYRVSTTRAKAIELLERMRELGNRVSSSGQFDTRVDRLIGDFELRRGLRSDPVKDYDRFMQAVRQLPQQLTLESEPGRR